MQSVNGITVRTAFGLADNKSFWRTGTGQQIEIHPENLAEYTLQDGRLYVLVCAGQALWVGSAVDLIEDQVSRERFKYAVKSANAVFSIASPLDDTEKLCLMHDVLAGHELNARNAA